MNNLDAGFKLVSFSLIVALLISWNPNESVAKSDLNKIKNAGCLNLKKNDASRQFLYKAINRWELSPEQASILAITDMGKTDSGFTLQHNRFDASFTPEGVYFFSGKGGLDWHWQLEYAGAEESTASVAAQVDVSPSGDMTKRIVRYNRGVLVEQYVVHMHSLEQQFIISNPLSLNGSDLIIEGHIKSSGMFEKHSEGWLWRNKKAVVSLGDVYVYDAKGEALSATMKVTATGTRIQVDGESLAHAVYPVTIDPEVGTDDFRISDMGPDGHTSYHGYDPAVAFNSIDNEYLVVWLGDDDTGAVINNEYEIYGQRIDGSTGAEIGSDFRISDMGLDGDEDYDAFDPAVAYNSKNNEYLVVWSGDDGTGSLEDDEYEIYGQRINGSTGAEIGNDFRISDMGPDGNNTFDAYEPSIAYNSTNNQFLVVWSGDDYYDFLADLQMEIFGQCISSTGTEVGTNDFRISNSGPDGDHNYGAYDPAIAYNSTNNECLVVWHGTDDAGSTVLFEYEIFGQRINGSTGAEIGSDFRISDMGPDGNSNYNTWDAGIAYNSTDNEYLVVWQGDDGLIGNREVYGQRINAFTGAEVGTNDFPISDMGYSTIGALSPKPVVAYNNTDMEYLVVWHGTDNTGSLVNGEHEILGQRIIGPTGVEVGGNDFRISNMGPDGNDSYDAYDPAVVYNSTANEFLLVWEADDNTGSLVNSEYEIYGQRWKTNGALDVTIPENCTEGDGSVQGTVATPWDPGQDLVITLSSSDSSEVSVPSSVTIPSGQTSVTFNLTIIDDTVTDGTQTVIITASANDWAWGNDNTDVLDNDNSLYCPDCSGPNVTIQDFTYEAGSDCQCSADSIMMGPNVIVQTGAKVRLTAPIINFNPEVTVETGADFKTSQ